MRQLSKRQLSFKGGDWLIFGLNDVDLGRKYITGKSRYGIHIKQLVRYWDQRHLVVVVDYLVIVY